MTTALVFDIWLVQGGSGRLRVLRVYEHRQRRPSTYCTVARLRPHRKKKRKEGSRASNGHHVEFDVPRIAYCEASEEASPASPAAGGRVQLPQIPQSILTVQKSQWPHAITAGERRRGLSLPSYFSDCTQSNWRPGSGERSGVEPSCPLQHRSGRVNWTGEATGILGCTGSS